MTNFWTTYLLTLVAAFIVYWMFGTMMTVSAGPTNYVPVISFWASVLQFGIGSWLFMHSVRLGRLVGIILGLLTIVWPLVALVTSFEFGFVGMAIYGLPIIMTFVVLLAHFKKLNDPKRPNKSIRIVLSLGPFAVLVTYVIYLVRLGYFG